MERGSGEDRGGAVWGLRVVRASGRVAVRVASLCLVGFGDPACRGEVGKIAGGREGGPPGAAGEQREGLEAKRGALRLIPL